jgi:hypothetical protein
MQVDEAQMFYKGGEFLLIWVVFFANPDWLIQLLELSVGPYVAEII